MATAKSTRRTGIFLLAAIVGAIGGLLGCAYHAVLEAMQLLGLAEGPSLPEAGRHLSAPLRVVVPAVGGLMAALCLRTIRNRRSPFGITDTVGMVATRQGVINLRDSITQILSSACSIATGSSIGKESANAQMGATVASVLADRFRSSSRDRAVLLGCGVSAGMAISYNAPIAGALFVMEVVLGNFAMDVFAPVVVTALIATLVHRELLPMSSHALYSPGEVVNIYMMAPPLVLASLLLGGVCGVGAIGVRHVMDLGHRLFSSLRLPLLLSMPLGGAAVGAIGIAHPEVWGNGREVVTSIITYAPGYRAVQLLFMIMLLKVVATSLSLGSGALGGIFTPNLVIGASLGAVYGHIFMLVMSPAQLDLTPATLSTGFALVGMAGLVAATTHAPITAVLLVFEFTRNYNLILPVMACSIVASLVARKFDPNSFFTARLAAKRHALAGGLEALAMQTNYVRDVMRADYVAVRDTATFDEVMDQFASARRDTVFVVLQNGTLFGRIHIHDVKFFINDPTLATVVIAADLTRPAASVTPEESLAEIFHLFDDPDLEVLPVVRGKDDARLIGRLTRRDVIALLSDEVLGHRTLRAKLKVEGADEDTYVQLPPGAALARVPVPDSMVGRALDSLALEVTPLVVIETSDDGVEQRLLPRPGLVLGPHSAMVVLGSKEAVAALEKPQGEAVAPPGPRS